MFLNKLIRNVFGFLVILLLIEPEGIPLYSPDRLSDIEYCNSDPLTGRFNRTDDYPGNNQAPQSLHKYLYCHGNPINGIDPSSERFSNLVYGKIVHDKIGDHFLNSGLGRYYDRTINKILNTRLSWWGRHRPDLVDTIGIAKNPEVYEIKPRGSYFAGVVQLGWYLYLLNSNDPLERKWIPGTTYIPPAIITINEFCFAFVDPPFAGVITYEVYDFKPILSALACYLAYRIDQELATAELIDLTLKAPL